MGFKNNNKEVMVKALALAGDLVENDHTFLAFQTTKFIFEQLRSQLNKNLAVSGGVSVGLGDIHKEVMEKIYGGSSLSWESQEKERDEWEAAAKKRIMEKLDAPAEEKRGTVLTAANARLWTQREVEEMENQLARVTKELEEHKIEKHLSALPPTKKRKAAKEKPDPITVVWGGYGRQPERARVLVGLLQTWETIPDLAELCECAQHKIRTVLTRLMCEGKVVKKRYLGGGKRKIKGGWKYKVKVPNTKGVVHYGYPKEGK